MDNYEIDITRENSERASGSHDSWGVEVRAPHDAILIPDFGKLITKEWQRVTHPTDWGLPFKEH